MEIFLKSPAPLQLGGGDYHYLLPPLTIDEPNEKNRPQQKLNQLFKQNQHFLLKRFKMLHAYTTRCEHGAKSYFFLD